MHWVLGRATVRAIAIAILMVASACDRFFIVKPEGQLGEAITFRFYDGRNDSRPSEHNIVLFLVQEEKGQRMWSSTWELSGALSLDSVTYGRKYDRLVESAPAVPLAIGKHYRVFADDFHRFTIPARGSAEGYFSINEDGQVVVERPRY